MAQRGHLERFDETTEDWSSYVERLELYVTLNSISDSLKVPLLCTSIGPTTYRLLKDLVAPVKPGDLPFQVLVDHLSGHFQPKRLRIAERYRFYKRDQLEMESLQAYIVELKHLSTHCEFGTQLKEMLCDRFVCGLRSDAIKRKLLTEAQLDFDRAVAIAIGMETAEKDAREIQHSRAVAPTNAVFSMAKTKKAPKSQAAKSRSSSHPAKPSSSFSRPQDSGPVGQCYTCGEQGHFRRSCRFTNAECTYCKKLGHIEKACRKKIRANSAHQVRTLDPLEIINNLGDQSDLQAIQVEVLLNGAPTSMELDSGAARSLMALHDFQSLCPDVPVEPTGVRFKTYSGEVLIPAGVAQVQVQHGSKSISLPLFVMDGNRHSLFGREWIQAFGLASLVRLHHVPVKDNLRSVLASFKDVFQDGIGKLNFFKTKLYLKENSTPIFFKARPVPYAMQQKVEEELDSLEAQGILERINYSEWATPIVPVLKANGSVRICGDFKITLNTVLKGDEYPLPRIDDLFSKLAGGSKFSKIDLSQAYLHMEVDENSRHLLTISTHKGLYRYTRMVFGLSCAPAIWQRTMEQVLEGIEGVCVYLDDVLITGPNEDVHVARLKEVLTRFRKYNLRANKAKSDFMVSSVEYLGFRIDEHGLHQSPAKNQAILKAPIPQDAAQVHSFTGLVNYYGRFLPNLSSIMHPLYHLLKKNVPFHWSKACQRAFEQVKAEIASERVLTHFNSQLPIIVDTDASPYGLGCVLSHRMTDGSERPFLFASRSLSAAERNYSQIHKEATAIFWSVKKHFQYLMGRRFVLRIDHKPLVAIFGSKSGLPALTATRLLHYALFLQSYDFDIIYRKSSDHSNADCLSRLPQNSEECTLDETFVFQVSLDSLPVLARDVASATQTDATLSHLKQSLVAGLIIPKNSPFRGMEATEFTLEQGCILRGHRILIPASLQGKVLAELHEGHMGIEKMKSLARSYVYWPELDKDIEQTVKNCRECMRYQTAPPRQYHPWERPPTPWSRIHIDFAGPFLGTNFLIVVDAHSKWLEVVPMRTITSWATIDELRIMFARYGCPDVLVSDNGSQFKSTEFQRFLTSNGVKHLTSAPYHPASNGQAERYVQTIKQALRKLQFDRRSLNQKLSSFLMRHRRTENASTGQSPSVLMLGRPIKTRLDLLRPSSDPCMSHRPLVENSKPLIRRSFQPGQPVAARQYGRQEKWKFGTVINRRSMNDYNVLVEGDVVHRNGNQLRPTGVNIEPDISESDDFQSVASPPASAPPNASSTSVDLPDTVSVPSTAVSKPTDSSSATVPITTKSPTPPRQGHRPAKDHGPPTRKSSRKSTRPQRYGIDN